MAEGLLKKGSRGEPVSKLQSSLAKLGFQLEVDGIFGDATHRAVTKLQQMFGYDVDGIVGPGTRFLIDQQLGLGWNVNAPDAAERAKRAQEGAKK